MYLFLTLASWITVLAIAAVAARAFARHLTPVLTVPVVLAAGAGLLAFYPGWAKGGADAPMPSPDRNVAWILLFLPALIGMASGAGAGWLARRPASERWDEVEW